MNKTALYELKKVEKIFESPKEKIRILKDINLIIEPKVCLAVVGASGSGKTTLWHLMAGLDNPSSGDILFQGKEITQFTLEEKAILRNIKIGFVFQFHHLLPEFNTLENVAMPGLISGFGKKEILDHAWDMLKKVRLEAQAKQPVATLSGGERQRAAIARAIMQSPEVILADEPTGNLDPENGEKIIDLLLDLNKSWGTTLVVVTHNQKLADKMSKKVELINGSLYEQD